jgi:hypothetical protein
VKSKDLVWRGLCKILGLICQLARGASENTGTERLDFSILALLGMLEGGGPFLIHKKR